MFLNPNLILDTIYPVGSLYLTTNATDPSKIFGGTWEQITSDAYLKIVDSDAGSLGGTSSEHKIPTSSMPSHSHGVQAGGKAVGGFPVNNIGFATSIATYSGSGGLSLGTISSSGGGKAYYPYYYGIYVFKRIA